MDFKKLTDTIKRVSTISIVVNSSFKGEKKLCFNMKNTINKVIFMDNNNNCMRDLVHRGWVYGVGYGGDFYTWEIINPEGKKREGKLENYPKEDFFVSEIKKWIREVNLDKLLDD
jgi:hypothetical protein